MFRLLCAIVLAFTTSIAALADDFRLCGRQVDDRSFHGALPGDAAISDHPDAPASLLMRRIEVTADGPPRDPQFCGAALIARDWAITARHCVDQKRWYDMPLAGGAHLVGDPEQGFWRRGEAAFCPTAAQPGKIVDDIALIRLDRPAPMNAIIPPLADVAASFAMAKDMNVTIGSWRWADAQRLRAPISVNPYRVAPTNGAQFLAATRIFAHKPAPCGGESGSVAITDIGGTPTIIGILSAVFDPQDQGAGAICKRAGARALLTPVARYRKWIEETIATCDADVPACLNRELSFLPHEP